MAGQRAAFERERISAFDAASLTMIVPALAALLPITLLVGLLVWKGMLRLTQSTGTDSNPRLAFPFFLALTATIIVGTVAALFFELRRLIQQVLFP